MKYIDRIKREFHLYRDFESDWTSALFYKIEFSDKEFSVNSPVQLRHLVKQKLENLRVKVNEKIDSDIKRLT